MGPLRACLLATIAAWCIAAAQAEILVGVPAPYTGRNAWIGGQTERGAKLAVRHLNEAGGILGEPIGTITADDYCNGDQAVAAARKLIAHGVDVVMGHDCSGAAIPASAVYAEAGVLMIAHAATNPMLTEQGFANVFRVCGRDDQQGRMAGSYLAEHWGDGNIAILHDGKAYGRGLATETKKALNARGIREALFESIKPGLVDYFDVVEKLEASNIDVLYYAGYSPEAALLIRQLRARGNDLQLVSGDGIAIEDFGLIAGEAAEGTLFTTFQDARFQPRATAVVDALRAEKEEPDSGTLMAYAAMQVWAQAVERAGTLELDAVIESLRSNQFDTILGTIGFDGKGDVTGYDPFAWYVWKGDTYEPADPADPAELAE